MFMYGLRPGGIRNLIIRGRGGIALSRRRRSREPHDTVTVKALLVLPWNTDEPSY
jgi:hypothetical protein